MAETSVHLPPDVVAELDRLAEERGVSRNRLIVEACRRAVEERVAWPDGFSDHSHLSDDDVELLQSTGELTDAILNARRS